jgi:16S rRNA (guanine527-N7)-methyltransferase
MSGPCTERAAVLRRGLSMLDVPDVERAAVKLEMHLAELDKWNPRHGLVKAGPEDLVIRHVLDSLAAWKTIRELAAPDPAAPGSVLDIGSGAGFPGIPLAVVLPELSFTLMERSGIRAAFLGNCAVLLGLSGLRVREEDLAKASGRYDVVTMRAFAPLARLLADLGKSRVEWRAIVAYKGRADRLGEEIGELETRADFHGKVEVRRIEVPFLDEERHLAVIRAAGPTSPREDAREA